MINNLTIDGDRRHLIANRGPQGSLPGYQPVPPVVEGLDMVMTYFDVEAEKEDIELLARKRGVAVAVTPQLFNAPRPSDAELEAFCEQLRDERRANGTPPPSREELGPLLTKEFGAFAYTRQTARDLRKRFWPEESMPGRRRKPATGD